MRFFIIFLSVLLFSLASHGQVYTWINEHGVRVYGDKPPADAEKAELPKLQSLPDVKPPSNPTGPSKVPSTDGNGFSGYLSFDFLTPQNEATITYEKEGTINAQLQLQPMLQIGHEVTLLLDGKAVDKGASLQFELKNVDRGSHLIQALVKHQGRLLIKTPKRRIHVQRPSILNRSRTQ
jgi:hypothetical protein